MTTSYQTCLLIDDNYIDSFITRKLIESANFAKHIVVSESPQAAIELLAEGEVKPDVIFLDIRMPLMSGFEFLEAYDKLELEKEGTKIFILSSSLSPTDIKRSYDNKYVTHFIHKPLTQKILEELP